jgi:uncharacterized membrane protein
MAAPFAVVTLAVLFVVIHLVGSSARVRGPLVRWLGELPFRGLYSLAAFAVLGSLGWQYFNHRHAGPLLWTLRSMPGVTVLANLGMLAAWTLGALTFTAPPPSGIVPGEARARGVLRVTRHPLMIGFVCFGLSHLLVTGWLTDVAFFGSFTVLGIAGAMHQDRRKCVEVGPSYAAFCRETSLVPFAAILAGRQKLVRREIPLAGLAVGAGLDLGFALGLHHRLFGVSPW